MKMSAICYVLFERYVFRGYWQVRRFLEAEPYLVPLLFEAYDEIRRLFGQNTGLALELTYDPDGGPESGELFALVQTSESVEEALAKLQRLDTEWWLATSRQARGKMNIDVELVLRPSFILFLRVTG
jgi:hypothetical protein